MAIGSFWLLNVAHSATLALECSLFFDSSS
jgi:hypothetical protein